MRVSVGRHSAGGDLPVCLRAGSEGGERERFGAARAIRHRRVILYRRTHRESQITGLRPYFYNPFGYAARDKSR